MKDINNSPLWREFEKLAARIETTLSPLGAIIRTPDKVLDLVTNEMREVDASIKYRIEDREILITLECRRRNQKQDVTWIEQLITKKRDIGANATIAITSRGASDPAKIKANKENISIKKLIEVTSEEMKSWLNLKFCEMVIQEYALIDIALALDELEENEEISYDPEILKLVGNDKFRYPIFEHKVNGQRYTCDEPLRLAQNRGFDLYEGCEEGQSKIQQLNYKNHDNNIVVTTNKGKRSVQLIHLTYKVTIKKEQIPIGYLFRYGKTEEETLEGVEFDLSSVFHGGILSLQKNSNTGKFDLHLLREKK